MKKLLLALIFLIIQIGAFAQFRNLKGDTICTNCSVNMIKTKYGYKNTGTAALKTGVVIYEMLSGKPLFLDVTTKAKALTLLNEFKREKYKQSWRFFDDIETMVDNGSLKDLYLLEKVGKPSEVIESFETGRKISVYQYPKIGLTVYFLNSTAIKYVRINT